MVLEVAIAALWQACRVESWLHPMKRNGLQNSRIRLTLIQPTSVQAAMRTKRIAIFLLLVVVITIAFLVVTAPPQVPVAANAATVKTGMSRAEVQAVLGRPDTRGVYNVQFAPVPYWRYHGPRHFAPDLSLAPLEFSLFEYAPGPRVDFDASGRVVRVQIPESK